MPRPTNLNNLFNSEQNNKRGENFIIDNPRENIDPHVRTKVLDTKEIIQDGISYNLATIGGSGDVSSVFTRSGAVVAATNDYTWAQLNKATSDIADITTKSHTSLSNIGTNTHAVIDAEIVSISGATLFLNSEVVQVSGATLEIASISGATILNQNNITEISAATLQIASISAATLEIIEISNATLQIASVSGMTLINKDEIYQVSQATLVSGGGDCVLLHQGSPYNTTDGDYGVADDTYHISAGALTAKDTLMIIAAHTGFATGTGSACKMKIVFRDGTNTITKEMVGGVTIWNSMRILVNVLENKNTYLKIEVLGMAGNTVTNFTGNNTTIAGGFTNAFDIDIYLAILDTATPTWNNAQWSIYILKGQ